MEEKDKLDFRALLGSLAAHPVARGQRLRLPTQGTPVPSLAQEDPANCGAAKPVSLCPGAPEVLAPSAQATTAEAPIARALQSEEPRREKPDGRSREGPTRHSQRGLCSSRAQTACQGSTQEGGRVFAHRRVHVCSQAREPLPNSSSPGRPSPSTIGLGSALGGGGAGGRGGGGRRGMDQGTEMLDWTETTALESETALIWQWSSKSCSCSQSRLRTQPRVGPRPSASRHTSGEGQNGPVGPRSTPDRQGRGPRSGSRDTSSPGAQLAGK